MADNIGLLAQYGLPSGTLDDYRLMRGEQQREKILSAPSDDGKAAGIQDRGWRALGIALADKMGAQGPKMTEQEKRMFQVTEQAQNRFAKLREESPELWKGMSADDKAQTYLKYVADSAFESGMPDVGAQAMKDYADRMRQTQRQDREFEQLGHQTKSAAAQAETATRQSRQAGELVRLERGGQTKTLERDNRGEILRSIREGWNPTGYPQTTRMMQDAYDKKGREALAAGDAEWYGKTMMDGEDALKRSRYINTYLGELEEARQSAGGFQTGFAAPLRMGLGVALEFFGIPVPDIVGDPRAAQRMDAVSAQLAVDLADHMSRVTNMSLGLVKQSVPNLSRTVGGNQLIAEMMALATEHEIAKARFLESFRSEHGGLEADDGTTARTALWRWERDSGLVEQVVEMEARIREEDRAIRKSGVTWRDVAHATEEVARAATVDRSPGTLPPGLPSGSQAIGRTPDGRDVYQLPDGTKVVYEGQ
jgi:hypothetical protein